MCFVNIHAASAFTHFNWAIQSQVYHEPDGEMQVCGEIPRRGSP